MSDRLLDQLNREVVELARRVVPSTAIISGQTRDFGRSSGSAWIYRDAFLVTNHHVIEDLATPMFARLPGHSRIEITVRGSDPLTDLAVLELERPVGPSLALRLDAVALGELCFAFGSPLGEFPESVTTGVVSGLRRRIVSPGGRTIEDALQIDAAINHGNSGGPLVDVSGRVIGVNSQGIDSAQNIGFAIGAPTVARIAEELLEHGAIERATLGISLGVVDVEADGGSHERMTVTSVKSEGARELEPGDVLLRVDGIEVVRRGDLFNLLDRSRIDLDLDVEVMRGQETTHVRVRAGRLGERVSAGVIGAAAEEPTQDAAAAEANGGTGLDRAGEDPLAPFRVGLTKLTTSRIPWFEGQLLMTLHQALNDPRFESAGHDSQVETVRSIWLGTVLRLATRPQLVPDPFQTDERRKSYNELVTKAAKAFGRNDDGAAAVLGRVNAAADGELKRAWPQLSALRDSLWTWFMLAVVTAPDGPEVPWLSEYLGHRLTTWLRTLEIEDHPAS